jgi:2-polyprenyl-3-methyl-5-hydroxy-6-metoxy-1,4-benzoquinol methylase
MTQSLEARLRRLERERDEADRRYNEALTELDRAVPPAAGPVDPAPALDEHQLAALNQAWNILQPPAGGGGLRQTLASFGWRVLAPILHRQLTFNSLLVDHINRNAEAERASHRRQLETAAALRGQIEALARFHTRLVAYFQQITAYVDTRDRHAAGGALVLNAAISDVAESQGKYRESLAAREHRYQAVQNELRDVVVVTQQAVMTLKRAFEQLQTAPVAAGSGGEPAVAPAAPPASLDSFKYVGFEERFRGSQETIRERQESFLPFFADLRSRGVDGDVLDVGCGRGEFIELLQSRGIAARGIDLNDEMVEICRDHGLRADKADAVGYLAAQPDGSLGGIFAAQVVEHMEPAYLLRFLDLSFAKLQPGGRLVLETLNPACWTAFFESYIRDITHRWPLHPETLKYLVTASGFARATIEFRSPVPPHEQLQPVALPAGADAALRELTEVVNENARKLNARMFTHMDYAVVAERALPA